MKKIGIILLLLLFSSVLFAKSKAVLYQPVGETPPITYESEEWDPEGFFKDNYQATWKKLPKFEQYAIAFSSILFDLNNQYHLDFSGKTVLNKYSSDPAKLLEDSWGITDYDSLIENFNTLEEYGHSGAYKMLSGLLDKYPDKNPLEIGVEEKLDILDVTRLFYVRDSRQAAGIRGIEAWDEGRQITILRWGIASGYISEEEAKKLMEPVVERIKNDYLNWEDYVNHYYLGRGFYALYNASSSSKIGEAIFLVSHARAYVPLNSIKFTGKNAVKKYVNPLNYEEGEDYKAWLEVQKLYSKEFSEDVFEKLLEFEKKYSDYSTLFFEWHVNMLAEYGSDEEFISYVNENAAYVDSLAQDSDLYVNTMYNYLASLNASYQPVTVISIVASLPDFLQSNAYFYYQYTLANFLMITYCESQAEFETYKERARSGFLLLKESGFSISESQEAWLKTFE